MGSLMSGWSSSALSDKEVRLMRNRSLTKDEVEAFWRKHGGRPAENGEETTIPLAARQLKVMRSMPPLRGGTRSDDDPCSPCGGRQNHHLFPRSEPSSPATTTTRGERFFFPGNDDADTSSTSRGWWTRSSWAFLNEPPPKEEVLLGRAHQISFACDQFHAARIVTGNA
ncbi:unnamed protein product [Urochloa decumbens]|uniref:Uncharacterized protein n=1 Tax=Urochloa decumbens TaxID=240449 RepID=A0ABC8Y1S0_9POAL